MRIELNHDETKWSREPRRGRCTCATGCRVTGAGLLAARCNNSAQKNRSPQNTDHRPNGPGGCDRGDGVNHQRGQRAGAVPTLSPAVGAEAMTHFLVAKTLG